MANKPWHKGSFTRRARLIRQAADADPTTRCWRCGRTKAEHGRKWTAGHLLRADPDSPLLPECQLCASREGQALTAAILRARNRPQTVGPSREW